MDGIPTMSDVARAAGVSQMTVSRALRGHGQVRAKTRAHILAVAADLGYFPNRAASELASRSNRSIGIIVPTLQDSIYASMLEKVGAVLGESGYGYVLQSVSYHREREPAALRALIAQRVRAMMIPAIGHSDESRAIIAQMPIPYVEFGSHGPDNIGVCVGHSDYEAGLEATRRLIAAGRRRIAIICGLTNKISHARDRYHGYRDALTEAGIDVDPSLIADIETKVTPGIKAFDALLELNADIDGVVVAGEIWAPGVALRAHARGIRVPEQMSIIGIADFELAIHLPVPLTVVALPREETGRVAAKIIIDMCESPHDRQEGVRLPLQLIERASV